MRCPHKLGQFIKYEVELFRGNEDNIGSLSVLFRTQSEILVASMTEFFLLWEQIETSHLPLLTGTHPDYAVYEGKFLRSISAPDRDCTAEELAQAISEYITLFDTLMKAFLSGKMDSHEVESAYYSHMINSAVHI